MKERICNLTKRLFADIQESRGGISDDSRERKKRKTLSPIPLHVDGLHTDQIWKQIDRMVRDCVSVFKYLKSLFSVFYLQTKRALDELTAKAVKLTNSSDASLELIAPQLEASETIIESEPVLPEQESTEENEISDSNNTLDDESQHLKNKQERKKRINPLDDGFFKFDEVKYLAFL